MGYSNNARKYVAVLNGKFKDQVGMLMNALGHTTAGLVFDQPAGQNFQKYVNERAEISSSISEFPFNVLKSKNGNQLRTLHEALVHAGVQHNVFVKQMIGSSALEQITSTRDALVEDLEFVAVAAFAEAEVLEPMTKKFSLYR